MTTVFQQAVYNVVKNIPRGQTLTYKQVALKIRRPNAYRAVGNALNKNRDAAVPCHRVVSKQRGVGGYNKGTRKKMKLLAQEGAI